MSVQVAILLMMVSLLFVSMSFLIAAWLQSASNDRLTTELRAFTAQLRDVSRQLDENGHTLQVILRSPLKIEQPTVKSILADRMPKPNGVHVNGHSTDWIQAAE